MKKLVTLFIVVLVAFISTAAVRNDLFEIAKQIEIFNTLFKTLSLNYVDNSSPAKLMEKAIDGVLEDLDPYTVFWNAQEVEDARIKNTGAYSGIGASIKSDREVLTVMRVFKGGPADVAGIKPGDEIIKIDNLFVKESGAQAGTLLKGEVGSDVNLIISRQNKTLPFTLKRGKVGLKSVPYYAMHNNNVGYIAVERFVNKTAFETQTALEALTLQGATSIIIDLRGNPGGLLQEAINMVGLFVPKGTVVTSTRSHIKKYNKTYRTTNNPIALNIPLVILIDGRSASASEIVSGALQDLDRAVIIGSRSFGKGLVQRPLPLSYGTQLKVTISRYYTPSGRCIQALDYWNRDENGDPIRLDTKEVNMFTTTNGRKVYDGGGITPDISFPDGNYSAITTALLKDALFFNYATAFFYKNEFTDLNKFYFTEKDFNAFLSFVNNSGFTFETQEEKDIKIAFERSKTSELQPYIKNAYNTLEDAFEKGKQALLRDKEPEIYRLLTKEIIQRYFYTEGVYTYGLSNHNEVLKAVEVLENQKRYKSILSIN